MADDTSSNQPTTPPPLAPPASPPPGAPGMPPGQGQPQYVYIQQATNGMAVAALVLGIIGTVFGLIPLFFWLALILGVLATIFGVIGMRKAKQGAGRKGMATAGLVLGIISLALGIIGAVIVGQAAGELEDEFRDLENEIERELQEDNP